ncbi:uncharacterized protein LOC144991199 isoform X3 [Oryzias latipes]
MDKDSAMDNPKYTEVERKTSPKKKKKVTFPGPIETPEPEPTKPSTSTPVRKLKKKRQEDDDEGEIMKPKKLKTSLKDSSSCDAKQIATSSELTERDDLITDKDKFEAKYVEEYYFASGGYGSIFSGFRKSDNLPVAVKHIFKRKITNKKMVSCLSQILRSISGLNGFLCFSSSLLSLF